MDSDRIDQTPKRGRALTGPSPQPVGAVTGASLGATAGPVAGGLTYARMLVRAHRRHRAQRPSQAGAARP
jgi:hypothetical protein